MNMDEEVKARLVNVTDAVKRFNAHPPKWFYVVAFIVLLLVFQSIRHI